MTGVRAGGYTDPVDTGAEAVQTAVTLSDRLSDRVRREAAGAGFGSEEELLEEALDFYAERAEADRRHVVAALEQGQASFDRGEEIPFRDAVRELRERYDVGPNG